MKRIKIGLFFSLVAWIIFAQSCMFFRTSDTKAAAEFTAKGIKVQVQYQTIRDVSMHYVKTGADTLPTLFFIHGSPGSWDAFKSYLGDSLLMDKFRLVSVDRPGFGYSDFGNAVDLQEQSAIISQMLRGMANGKPFYLIGHSLGGPLCVRIALDNPGIASGLILLSAALDPALEDPEKWRRALMNNPLQYLLPGAFRPSNYELWYLKSDLKILEKDISGATLPFIWMIHGNKDQFVPYGNVAFARKYFDSSRLSVTTLDGANHFIPWTYFNRIKEVLLQLPLVNE